MLDTIYRLDDLRSRLPLQWRGDAALKVETCSKRVWLQDDMVTIERLVLTLTGLRWVLCESYVAS